MATLTQGQFLEIEEIAISSNSKVQTHKSQTNWRYRRIHPTEEIRKESKGKTKRSSLPDFKKFKEIVKRMLNKLQNRREKVRKKTINKELENIITNQG